MLFYFNLFTIFVTRFIRTFLNFLLNPCDCRGGFVVLQIKIMIAFLIVVAVVVIVGSVTAVVVLTK